MTRVKPGKREPGKSIVVNPRKGEQVTVGPVTVKDDGSESFTVTVAPVPIDTRGGNYL